MTRHALRLPAKASKEAQNTTTPQSKSSRAHWFEHKALAARERNKPQTRKCASRFSADACGVP